MANIVKLFDRADYNRKTAVSDVTMLQTSTSTLREKNTSRTYDRIMEIDVINEQSDKKAAILINNNSGIGYQCEKPCHAPGNKLDLKGHHKESQNPATTKIYSLGFNHDAELSCHKTKSKDLDILEIFYAKESQSDQQRGFWCLNSRTKLLNCLN